MKIELIARNSAIKKALNRPFSKGKRLEWDFTMHSLLANKTLELIQKDPPKITVNNGINVSIAKSEKL